jgi:hypothetical protein
MDADKHGFKRRIILLVCLPRFILSATSAFSVPNILKFLKKKSFYFSFDLIGWLDRDSHLVFDIRDDLEWRIGAQSVQVGTEGHFPSFISDHPQAVYIIFT